MGQELRDDVVKLAERFNMLGTIPTTWNEADWELKFVSLLVQVLMEKRVVLPYVPLAKWSSLLKSLSKFQTHVRHPQKPCTVTSSSVVEWTKQICEDIVADVTLTHDDLKSKAAEIAQFAVLLERRGMTESFQQWSQCLPCDDQDYDFLVIGARFQQLSHYVDIATHGWQSIFDLTGPNEECFRSAYDILTWNAGAAESTYKVSPLNDLKFGASYVSIPSLASAKDVVSEVDHVISLFFPPGQTKKRVRLIVLLPSSTLTVDWRLTLLIALKVATVSVFYKVSTVICSESAFEVDHAFSTLTNNPTGPDPETVLRLEAPHSLLRSYILCNRRQVSASKFRALNDAQWSDIKPYLEFVPTVVDAPDDVVEQLNDKYLFLQALKKLPWWLAARIPQREATALPVKSAIAPYLSSDFDLSSVSKVTISREREMCGATTIIRQVLADMAKCHPQWSFLFFSSEASLDEWIADKLVDFIDSIGTHVVVAFDNRWPTMADRVAEKSKRRFVRHSHRVVVVSLVLDRRARAVMIRSHLTPDETRQIRAMESDVVRDLQLPPINVQADVTRRCNWEADFTNYFPLSGSGGVPICWGVMSLLQAVRADPQNARLSNLVADIANSCEVAASEEPDLNGVFLAVLCLAAFHGYGEQFLRFDWITEPDFRSRVLRLPVSRLLMRIESPLRSRQDGVCFRSRIIAKAFYHAAMTNPTMSKMLFPDRAISSHVQLASRCIDLICGQLAVEREQRNVALQGLFWETSVHDDEDIEPRSRNAPFVEVLIERREEGIDMKRHRGHIINIFEKLNSVINTVHSAIKLCYYLQVAKIFGSGFGQLVEFRDHERAELVISSIPSVPKEFLVHKAVVVSRFVDWMLKFQSRDELRIKTTMDMATSRFNVARQEMRRFSLEHAIMSDMIFPFFSQAITMKNVFEEVDLRRLICNDIPATA